MSTPDEQRSRMFRLAYRLANTYSIEDHLDASTTMAQIVKADLPDNVDEFIEVLDNISEVEKNLADRVSMLAQLRKSLCSRFYKTYIKDRRT